MQAASAAFAAVIEGQDVVVEHDITIRLPIFRTNLCLNPSFEYGLTGWLAAGGAAIAQSSVQKIQGDKSMLITWPTAGNEVAFAFMATQAPAGTVYTLSCWVFVPTGSSPVRLAADNAPIGTSTQSTVTNAWQRLSYTFTAVDSSFAIGILNTGSTAGQQCYVDGMLLEADTATTGSYFDGDSLPDLNLCANPSFEQPLLPEWWTATNCDAEQDDTWSVDGDFSASLTPNSGSNVTYISAGGDFAAGVFRCGLVPGNTYTISATVNVPAALTGSASAFPVCILASWLASGTHTQASPSGPVAGGTQRLSVTFTLPANATAAWIELWNGYPNTAANVVRWDAVLVRRAPTDTGYFGGQRPSANAWLGAPGNSISQLNVDPYPDATMAVESITVEREITTDMPAGTRLISGYPTATATVVLSGNMDPTDENTNAAAVFGPYASLQNPTYHSDDIDSPVVIMQGVYNGAGTELLTVFTGGVDDVLVDPEAGTATLTCLDGRNRLRPTVVLPSVAYLSTYLDYAPGLSSHYVMDLLLRQNGIYTSPPARPNCFLYASMHGSVWPEVYTAPPASSGFTPSAIMAQNNLSDPVTFALSGAPQDYLALMTPGVWSPQVCYSPILTGFGLVGGHVPSLGSAGGFYFEGWLKADSTQDGTTGQSRAGVSSSGATFGSMDLSWAWNQGDAATVTSLTLTRVAGSSSKVIAGAAMSTDAYHHVAILVAFTGSTTATVTSTIDGVTTVNNITGLAAVGAEGAMTLANFGFIGWADSVQMTTETAPVPIRSFYPTAYLEASANPLIAMVDTTGMDPWTVIQQLAEAEQGVFGQDEQGVFRFRNRANLLAQPSGRVVSSKASLKTLQTDVGKSTLANHVTASVNALELSPGQAVWAATDPIYVAAHKTSTFLVSTTGTTLYPQALDFGYTASANIPGQTSWRASTSKAGATAVTSGILVSSVSISPTTLRVSIRNSNSFGVWMVSPAILTDVSAGTPFLYIGGQSAAAPATGVLASSVWQPSIDARSEVALPLPDNPWRQDATAAQQLTDDSVSDLYRPRPILENLTIVGDPRLRLLDRVTIQDPDGSQLAEDVVLSGIVMVDSATDWTQTLTARAIANPGDWLMGVKGRSETGQSTYS